MKTPAVGVPALLAAASLAATLLAPAASAAALAALPAPVAWAAHLAAASTWAASLVAYALLGEGGPLRSFPRKLVSPFLVQAQTSALAIAAAAGAVAAAAFVATGAADPVQRLLLGAALVCTFLDLTWRAPLLLSDNAHPSPALFGRAALHKQWLVTRPHVLSSLLARLHNNRAQPLRGQLLTYQLKLEKDAGLDEEPLNAPPGEGKMTPTLERMRERINRWTVASGLLTAAGAGALGSHLLCHVAGRLALGA